MSHDRRSFLRAVGTSCVGVLVAGCSEEAADEEPTATVEDGTDEPTETATPTPAGTDEPAGTPEEFDASAPQVITMQAGGEDIWDQNDLGHLYFDWVSGDFDVRVRVTEVGNTHAHAKGGLMARASLDANAANVMVRRRPPGFISVQWRPEKAMEARSLTSDAGSDQREYDGQVEASAQWQRLEREGETVRGYYSTDGEDWTLLAELGPEQINLPNEVFLGLAGTSHDRAELTTIKFRGLEGVEPSENTDIGNPIMAGSVTVSEPIVVAAREPEVSDGTATLRGALEGMGEADEIDLAFEYREVTESEWTRADVGTRSEPGTFEAEAPDLAGRRYYEFRAIAEGGEETATSGESVFASSWSSDGDSEGPASAAHHDPADGFAEVAPWLDDSTPIVTVAEPTREALERAINVNGPRVIVFETSGTFDLGGQSLSIPYDQCWIAGQTAPSPGITLIRGALTISANDCVVQHLRSRPGAAGYQRGDGWQPNAIETADTTENNVIDHCTGTWGIDETISVGYDTRNTTVSNCLIAEPLHDSTHYKGVHPYGSLLGNDGKNVTIAGNVYAQTLDRNVRVKQGVEAAIVNNAVHHYSDGTWLDPDTLASVVGNVYRWPVNDQPVVFGEGQAYVEDTVLDWDAENPIVGPDVQQVDSEPLWPEGMEAMPSGETLEHNLENAGARPADRTDHDERILEDIANDGGEYIDHQDEVGGYPELAANAHELDVPESGLRAWLRERALDVEA